MCADTGLSPPWLPFSWDFLLQFLTVLTTLTSHPLFYDLFEVCFLLEFFPMCHMNWLTGVHLPQSLPRFVYPSNDSVSCSVLSDSLQPHGPRQALLSMGFPKQGYWSGLPFPSRGSSQPRDLLHGASLVAQTVKNLPSMQERPRFNPWVRKIPCRNE